jgi:hypothetical protein
MIPPQLKTGDPVTEVPGHKPRFPQSMVDPLVVIVVPANTA